MYKIIRFYKDKGAEVLKTGLSLKEAKEHCNNAETSGENFFDGFSEE